MLFPKTQGLLSCLEYACEMTLSHFHLQAEEPQLCTIKKLGKRDKPTPDCFVETVGIVDRDALAVWCVVNVVAVLEKYVVEAAFFVVIHNCLDANDLLCIRARQVLRLLLRYESLFQLDNVCRFRAGRWPRLCFWRIRLAHGPINIIGRRIVNENLDRPFPWSVSHCNSNLFGDFAGLRPRVP